jgi:hypothetical protein
VEVNLMFKWLRPRRRDAAESVSDSPEADRDTGEEELESHEELADEIAPSGMTRMNTDEI